MNKLAMIVLFLMFVGCTATKINPVNPVPVFEIPKGSKIGVINFVGQKIRRYGVMFDGSQSETVSEATSDIPNFINYEIKRQAAEIGYKVEILDVNDDIKRSLSFCTMKDNDQIILRSATIPIFQQLSNDHNLSIIYIIKEAEGKFKIQDLYVVPRGYGMAVELPKGIFTAFAILKAEAIYLDPVSVTRGAECLEKKILEGRVISEKNEPTRKLLPQYEVTENIKLIINKFISDLLKNSNLLG